MVATFSAQLACLDAGYDGVRLDAELCAAVAGRFAPLARPTGVPASGPCPEPYLVDGRLDLTCADNGIDPELRTLGSAVRRLGPGSDDPAVLRIRALWHLAIAGAGDRPVELFEAALERDISATRHNDLAAALLLRAARVDRSVDLVAALDHAAVATALAPELAEARANLELALASMGLPTPEEADTEEHPKDTNGSAKEHRIRGQDLLGQWAQAYSIGDPAAGGYLETVRGLALDGTDRTLAEAVEIVVKAVDERDNRRLDNLARGHAGFHRLATPACGNPDALARADAALAAARTPFRAWTLLERATCAYFSPDYGTASVLVGEVLAHWGTGKHGAVVARAQGLLGLIAMRQGRFAAAHEHYLGAIESGRASGELDSAVYFQAMAARNLAIAGQREEAWRLRLPALRERSMIADPVRIYSVVEDTVQALQDEGRPWAALAVSAEQIRAARTAADIDERNLDLVAFGWLDHAESLRGMGRDVEASKALDVAADSAPLDHWNRGRLENEISTARALLGHADLATIDKALGFFSGDAGLQDRVEVLRLLRRRAEVALARGDVETADLDLRRGFDEIERQRLSLTDRDQRSRFLGSARDLVEKAVRVALEYHGDPLGALNTLESGTNRTLLDRAATGSAEDVPRLTAPALAALAPAGGLLVRWGHLEDRLLLWSIRPGDPALHLEERVLDISSLKRRVHAFRAAIRSEAPESDVRGLGEALTGLVLPTALDSLPPGAPLLLVPDDLLVGLPFSALLFDGDYLMVRHPLGYAPSLSMALRAARQTRDVPDGMKDLLVVSDPAFAGDRFPGLERLRGAPAGLAGATESVTILDAEAATRSAVMAALPEHRVVHIAAHNVFDPIFPSQGGILLADSPAGEAGDLLTPADIFGTARGGLDLVILAACSTNLGFDPGSSDVGGLAASFLSRGVPRVVTAAWPIDDVMAARFFAYFHEALRAESSPVRALHDAGRNMLEGQDGSRAAQHWAGFQLWLLGNSWDVSVLRQ